MIAYLDGELDPERRIEVQGLLESSWEARVRLSEIQRDIEAYVQATVAAPPEGFPHRDHVWTSLRCALQTEAGACAIGERSGLWAGWLRLVAGAFVLALFVATLAWVFSPPAISAKEVLSRAETAETERLAKVQSPVIHQRVRIRRSGPGSNRPEPIVWELWKPVGSDRFREALELADGTTIQPGSASSAVTEAALFSELIEVFEANGIDRQRPLSARAYGEWQRGSTSGVEVLRGELQDGTRAFTLRAFGEKSGLNAILQYDLQIRSDDWDPVMQRLKVQAADGLREYEISEAAHDILALRTLPLSFFDAGKPLVAPVRPLPAPFLTVPSTTVPNMLPTTPSPEQLAAAAVEAHFALHRAGACQTEAIDVVRGASAQVDVRGFARTQQRKEELVAALAGVPLLHLDIRLAEPGILVTGGMGSLGESLKALLDGTSADANRLRLGPDRDAWLASAQSLLEVLSADSRAVHRLAADFSSAHIRALPVSSRLMLKQMLHDHLTSLQRNLDTLGALFRPVLASSAPRKPSEGPPPQDLGWADEMLALCGSLESSLGMLAGGDRPSSVDEAVQDLLVAIPEWSVRIERDMARIAQEFKGSPGFLSSGTQLASPGRPTEPQPLIKDR